METHSSILVGKISWAEEPSGYSTWGCKELNMTEHTQIDKHQNRIQSNCPSTVIQTSLQL